MPRGARAFQKEPGPCPHAEQQRSHRIFPSGRPAMQGLRHRNRHPAQLHGGSLSYIPETAADGRQRNASLKPRQGRDAVLPPRTHIRRHTCRPSIAVRRVQQAQVSQPVRDKRASPAMSAGGSVQFDSRHCMLRLSSSPLPPPCLPPSACPCTPGAVHPPEETKNRGRRDETSRLMFGPESRQRRGLKASACG